VINKFESDTTKWKKDFHYIKMVTPGDGAVGKTCLLIRGVTKKFPEEYVPTVFDNYELPMSTDALVSLWDVGGREDYDRLRPLSYPLTDIFLLCFSLISPTSLSNVVTKWHPELQHHCPQTPILLVGLKKDLRENQEVIEKLQNCKQSPVTHEQGLEVAKKINAVAYREVSSLTGEGVEELFATAVELVVHPTEGFGKKKKRSWLKSLWNKSVGGLFKKVS